MVKIYTVTDNNSSLNTFSVQKSKERDIETIRKAKFDFSKCSRIYDVYKDNIGTNWVISGVEKSGDWKIWTTTKHPGTSDDAIYMTKSMEKNDAIELFNTIVGYEHDTILKSFQEVLKMPRRIK